ILYGKLRPYLDKAVVAQTSGICSTDVLVFAAKNEVPPEFVVSVLHTEMFVEHAKKTTHGVNHPRTSWKSIKEYSLAIPSLAEQKKIAAVLLKLQQAILIQEQTLDTLRELKKATMHKIFTEGLHGEETKETEFGFVPESWCIEPLGECCAVQTGITKGKKIAGDEAVELPYLRVANVQDGHLDLTNMKTIRLRRTEIERYSLQDGDVVLTEGGDFDKLGRGFVWENQVPNCVHQNHVFAVRADRTRLIPHFLAYLAQSPYGKAYFLSVAHKTTNLACINSTKLKGLPVPIPSMAEQQKIISIFQTLDKKIGVHERKRDTLNELFRTTLNQLMTAKIRVNNLKIDTSEVEG
ncbi:MAG: restriction endonuclease subunit S, partial [Pontiellaceae bacterium]|nr:restriction endonuclease subunit S [Pontiellaceae bacterium]